MNKLEIYAVILLMILGTNVGCFFYGVHWKGERNEAAQLKADAAALQEMSDAARRHANADNAAADTAEANRVRLQQGMEHVLATFGKLPNTVLDAHGCGVLSPAFGMRWASAAAVPAGSVDDPAPVKPAAAVPAGPVPPAQ